MLTNLQDYLSLTRLNLKNIWTKKLVFLLITVTWIIINLGFIIYNRASSDSIITEFFRNFDLVLVFTIYFNNFYLLLISIYLYIVLFSKKSSIILISMERRFGYKNTVIFFSRFTCILIVIISLNLLMVIFGSLSLINSTGFTKLLYNKSIQTYFVLMITVLCNTMIMMLIFGFTKIVIAIIGVVIYNFLLVVLVINSNLSFWNQKERIISDSSWDLIHQYEFFELTKSSSLQEIYQLKNFDETYNEISSLRDELRHFGLKEYTPVSQYYFWTMGQVLNIDDVKGGLTSDDKFILHDINPKLFDFFIELKEVLNGYKSQTKLSRSIFSDIRLNKVEMPDWKPFLNYLKSNNEFWSKYNNLFTYVLKDISMDYKYSKYWKQVQNKLDYYDVVPETGWVEQNPINDFYKRVPEFCIFAQAFMMKWFDVLSYPVFNVNKDEQSFVNMDDVFSYNKNYFWKTFVDFPNYWKVLNTSNHWTGFYINLPSGSYLTSNNTIDMTSFINVFDKNNYINNNYKYPAYYLNIKPKRINMRIKIFSAIYSLMVVFGTLLLWPIILKFKTVYVVNYE